MNMEPHTDSALAQERKAFSERLTQALNAAGYGAIRPTATARLFNARSPLTVTPHAVRKWMRGGSIPSQKHIQTLAGWLGCDAAWLRYGQPEVQSTDGAGNSASWAHDASLLADLSTLSAEARMLVDEFVRLLFTNMQAGRPGPGLDVNQ